MFDKNGSQLFHTKRSILSVNEGIILTLEGSTFDARFSYHNMKGETLYEYNPEYPDDVWAAGYSEDYAFFSDGNTQRMTRDGKVEMLADIVFGDQSIQEESNHNGGTIVDSVGYSFVMVVPLSPMNQGFYLTRGLVIESDSYGLYYLANADYSEAYCFDFSSIFNHQGLSLSRSGASWGLRDFVDNGCTYSNYGSIICPYITIDGKNTCYLIDTSKLVANDKEYVNPGEIWSEEDYWDYDVTVLTKEALLLEAESIIMSNENYWLFKKDGQRGYIDHAGNIMGMYDDAAEFYNGKAMIIENGVAYVIDESFAKIREVGAAVSVTNNGEVFKVAANENSDAKMIKVD